MSTVRRAALADIPALMALVKQEHALSRFSAMPFDDSVSASTFTQVISSMTGAIFISEGGFIGGIVQRNLFNKYTTAYELAWYAQDASGIHLLKAFAQWAQKMRAVELIVHHYSGIGDPARFNRVLQRQGFSPLGCSYSLTLQGA